MSLNDLGLPVLDLNSNDSKELNTVFGEYGAKYLQKMCRSSQSVPYKAALIESPLLSTEHKSSGINPDVYLAISQLGEKVNSVSESKVNGIRAKVSADANRLLDFVFDFGASPYAPGSKASSSSSSSSSSSLPSFEIPGFGNISNLFSDTLVNSIDALGKKMAISAVIGAAFAIIRQKPLLLMGFAMCLSFWNMLNLIRSSGMIGGGDGDEKITFFSIAPKIREFIADAKIIKACFSFCLKTKKEGESVFTDLYNEIKSIPDSIRTNMFEVLSEFTRALPLIEIIELIAGDDESFEDDGKIGSRTVKAQDPGAFALVLKKTSLQKHFIELLKKWCDISYTFELKAANTAKNAKKGLDASGKAFEGDDMGKKLGPLPYASLNRAVANEPIFTKEDLEGKKDFGGGAKKHQLRTQNGETNIMKFLAPIRGLRSKQWKLLKTDSSKFGFGSNKVVEVTDTDFLNDVDKFLALKPSGLVPLVKGKVLEYNVSLADLITGHHKREKEEFKNLDSQVNAFLGKGDISNIENYWELNNGKLELKKGYTQKRLEDAFSNSAEMNELVMCLRRCWKNYDVKSFCECFKNRNLLFTLVDGNGNLKQKETEEFLGLMTSSDIRAFAKMMGIEFIKHENGYIELETFSMWKSRFGGCFASQKYLLVFVSMFLSMCRSPKHSNRINGSKTKPESKCQTSYSECVRTGEMPTSTDETNSFLVMPKVNPYQLMGGVKVLSENGVNFTTRNTKISNLMSGGSNCARTYEELLRRAQNDIKSRTGFELTKNDKEEIKAVLDKMKNYENYLEKLLKGYSDFISASAKCGITYNGSKKVEYVSKEDLVDNQQGLLEKKCSELEDKIKKTVNNMNNGYEYLIGNFVSPYYQASDASQVANSGRQYKDNFDDWQV